MGAQSRGCSWPRPDLETMLWPGSGARRPGPRRLREAQQEVGVWERRAMSPWGQDQEPAEGKEYCLSTVSPTATTLWLSPALLRDENLTGRWIFNANCYRPLYVINIICYAFMQPDLQAFFDAQRTFGLCIWHWLIITRPGVDKVKPTGWFN